MMQLKATLARNSGTGGGKSSMDANDNTREYYLRGKVADCL